MTNRLLLDENLSERLVPLIAERFSDVFHLRIMGLGGSPDAAVWQAARDTQATLVTKDEDFIRLSLDLGWPPKVICLAIGSASNRRTAELVLANASTIEAFIEQQEAGFLLLQAEP